MHHRGHLSADMYISPDRERLDPIATLDPSARADDDILARADSRGYTHRTLYITRLRVRALGYLGQITNVCLTDT